MVGAGAGAGDKLRMYTEVIYHRWLSLKLIDSLGQGEKCSRPVVNFMKALGEAILREDLRKASILLLSDTSTDKNPTQSKFNLSNFLSFS